MHGPVGFLLQQRRFRACLPFGVHKAYGRHVVTKAALYGVGERECACERLSGIGRYAACLGERGAACCAGAGEPYRRGQALGAEWSI